MFQVLKQAPLTIVIVALAILSFRVPGLAEVLQLDFAKIGQGQWWRVLSGHVTHFSASHLFWDVIMFACLSAMCERESKQMYAYGLAAITLGVSIGVAALTDAATYRGLSGIDTGLFTWFIMLRLCEAWRNRDHMSTVVWSGAALGLAGKLVYEAVTNATIFVESGGFTPLVESHIAGGIVGIVAGLTIAFVLQRGRASTANFCQTQIRQAILK